MKYNGIDAFRDHSIIMLRYDDNHFEPLAIVQNKEALRVFPKISPFIARVHKKRT
jgi:hypothetical protein